MGLMKQNVKVVTVKGKGNSKNLAFAEALSHIQKQIIEKSNDSDNVLLQIEPLDVEVVSAKEIQETERFMFLFFPRKKVFYEVTLNVTIQIRDIDLKQVSFSLETEKISPSLKRRLKQLQ